MAHGILLYSGGLDSLIAAKVLLDQGITVTGFQCILPFEDPDLDYDSLETTAMARQINLNLVFHRCGRDYLAMLKDPPHGYGKNCNPCIDCKIHFIRRAAEYMSQVNADFVATGEVLGQRPMSQMKNTMNLIEKESGLKGKLVRPLSAKLLPPTIPEEAGLIDRERLLDINGRGRKRQMELAETYGIKQYSSPGGGCLFTDPAMSARTIDLLEHVPHAETLDIFLLTIGRHYRFDKETRLVEGRNERENNKLEEHAGHFDCCMIPDFKGPVACLQGNPGKDHVKLAASIIARHGKPQSEKDTIRIHFPDKRIDIIHCGEKIDDSSLESLRI